MSESADLRLDAELWARSPLGLVGPHGLFGDVAAGGQMVYRPLLVHHLDHAGMRNSLGRAVRVLQTFDEVRDIAKRPEVAALSHCPPELWRSDGARLWESDRKVGILVRDRAGDTVHAVLVAGLDRIDARVAHVSTCWVPNLMVLHTSDVDELLGAGWLLLFRELARRGAVRVTASEMSEGRDIVAMFRDIAGFRPAADIFGALGLARADHATRLAEWRATIENGSVTRFATRPEMDGPARGELLHRLISYFELAGRPPTDENDGEPATRPETERITLGGDIAIDGVDGWGNVLPDDWYRPESDDVASGWDQAHHQAMPAFLAWMRAELDAQRND